MHIAYFELRDSLRVQKQMKCLQHDGGHKITFLTSGSQVQGPHWNGLIDEYIDVGVRYPTPPFRQLQRILRIGARPINRRRLAYAVRQLNCDLIHAYGAWGRHDYTKVVIENARCPVVFDAYDFVGIRAGVQALRPIERESERYCFENADAIVTKFPDEVLNYYRELGYCLPGRILHHQDYCEDSKSLPIEIELEPPNEWHLVQGGGAAPRSWPADEHGYQQYHELAQLLNEQEINFHLYPSYTQVGMMKDLKCYQMLDERLQFFHLHSPKPLDEYRSAIQTYSLGSWIHPPFASHLTKYYWYGIGNKLAVYAEAGLPLVVNNELLFGSRIVRDNKIGITFDYDQIHTLRQQLDSQDWKQLRFNLAQFREKYSISQQSTRLINFYKQLIHHGDPSVPSDTADQ